MKIAITTSDGIKVDQHFGKADSFHIYEIKNGDIKAIEKRVVTPYCASDSSDQPSADHEYSIDRLSAVYEEIKDCKVLYTKQIGDKPMNGLNNLGIIVKPCNCQIESIVGCDGLCK